MKLSDVTRDILRNVSIQNNTVFLPNIQLNRNDYVAVDKALNLMGGTWNRKAKGHIFENDPTSLIALALETGEITDTKKAFQFYPTPNDVCKRMCELAQLDANSIVLEPSCGNGALADVIWSYHPKSLEGIELNTALQKVLDQKPYPVRCGIDFLNISGQWNRIIMNPPFTNGQDIKHVLHAFQQLAPGGILIAIVGAGCMFNSDTKSTQFRAFLAEHNAEAELLPAGTFKKSGTMVETYLIRIHKGE